ncbi:phosphatidylglycerol lysyltransferase domain-containing protein [Streptococcus halichoeri]|uniref:phosphatidylglycerol lysyltransferase domain-containing protein n=1 Tax=Streptococcus halichoeri TaxID=254785 RepID=UPI00135AFC0E|nr:phosphatidylglycerol lysyltransferase domain-containing protein [Streptococcus halichoeri]
MPFLQHLGNFITTKKVILKDMLTTLSFYLMIGLFYVSGILLVLMITSHDSIINLPLIKDKLYGLASMALIRQVPSLMLGFSLLVCGRAIANRVRQAFYPTLVFLALALLYTIFFYRSSFPSYLLGFLMVALWISRHHLYRQQLIISHEEGFLDGAIWLFLLASYVILGYTNLVDPRRVPRVSLEKHFSVPSFHWWLTGFLTLFLIVVVVVVFLTILKRQRHQIGSVFDAERYQALCALGDHHYTGLAYLGDKRIWYYQVNGQDKLGLQFKPYKEFLLVMGDFIGDKGYLEEGLMAFMTEADLYHFRPVFYEIPEKTVLAVHDFGFDFMKLGEEGLVKPEEFSISGKKRQNLRSVVNQVDKSGHQFTITAPPHSADLLAELEEVSTDWLNGRREMGFSLGYFSPNYLAHADLALIRSQQGKLVAFASLETSQSEQSLSVDLMRYAHDAPKGIMDVLFIKIIQYAKEQGLEWFNMGMSPLANVGNYRFSFVTERMGYLLYQLGSQIYSFEGLRHYKAKFAKTWEPYYIAYSKHSNFFVVVLALMKASYDLMENRSRK